MGGCVGGWMDDWMDGRTDTQPFCQELGNQLYALVYPQDVLYLKRHRKVVRR